MNIDNRTDVFATNAAGANPGTPKEVWLQNYFKQAKGAELYYEDTGTLNKVQYPIADGDELYIVTVRFTISGDTYYETVVFPTSQTYVNYGAPILTDTGVLNTYFRLTQSSSKIEVSSVAYCESLYGGSIASARSTVTAYLDQIWRIRA